MCHFHYLLDQELWYACEFVRTVQVCKGLDVLYSSSCMTLSFIISTHYLLFLFLIITNLFYALCGTKLPPNYLPFACII